MAEADRQCSGDSTPHVRKGNFSPGEDLRSLAFLAAVGVRAEERLKETDDSFDTDEVRGDDVSPDQQDL